MYLQDLLVHLAKCVFTRLYVYVRDGKKRYDLIILWVDIRRWSIVSTTTGIKVEKGAKEINHHLG